MFKNLRNRLIFINISITSVVLVVVFASIYIIYNNTSNNRPPEFDYQHMIISEDLENAIEIGFRRERQENSNRLLIMLLVSGAIIELIVAGVSYYLAEEAIKPVRDAYDSQRLFIANASHEIKTPLAAISANLEAADIKGNKWIKNVELETAKLTALNNQLLNLARSDIVERGISEEINPGVLTREIVDSFESRISNGDKGLNFKNHCQKTIILNREDFVQVLSILIDNAIKYSNKKILLDVSEHKVIISNDGAKITEKDLPHLFDRFYQVDKTSDGVGLGLSIAKSLAERNGWKLSAKTGKMSTFVLDY